LYSHILSFVLYPFISSFIPYKSSNHFQNTSGTGSDLSKYYFKTWFYSSISNFSLFNLS